eukprot:4726073-Alexandrium_andersonii.AAC.1
MSASLVGSEMCIRDRMRSSWAASQSRCRSAAAGRPGWRCRAAAMTQSVSYTHLTLPTICSV